MMIDEIEFERRVAHWYGLVLQALEENISKATKDSMGFDSAEKDNPDFLFAMEEAHKYRRKYLPEYILAAHLDPLVPPGYFHLVDRVDFLLQRGMAQHQAHRLSLHVIEMAKTI